MLIHDEKIECTSFGQSELMSIPYSYLLTYGMPYQGSQAQGVLPIMAVTLIYVDYRLDSNMQMKPLLSEVIRKSARQPWNTLQACNASAISGKFSNNIKPDPLKV
jgi:hypothetical protein